MILRGYTLALNGEQAPDLHEIHGGFYNYEVPPSIVDGVGIGKDESRIDVINDNVTKSFETIRVPLHPKEASAQDKSPTHCEQKLKVNLLSGPNCSHSSLSFLISSAESGVLLDIHP
jgi:hypothetical protein